MKQAHVGIALLNGNQEDLEKLANRLRLQRQKQMLEKQEELRKAWGLPNPNENQQNDISKGTKAKPDLVKSMVPLPIILGGTYGRFRRSAYYQVW